ncbi:UNVERIFIED_CONTAM: hypothetical protein HDU68_006889 [Siphonaria sp. JEL0065]|nr:hypothetical protein HDU68_006889 [Siphonaria sp. JEL0065]
MPASFTATTTPPTDPYMITLDMTTTEYYAALIGASAFVSLLVILNVGLVVALVRQRANYTKDTDSLTESDNSSSTCKEKVRTSVTTVLIASETSNQPPFNSPFNPNYKFPPKPAPEQKLPRVLSMRQSVPVLPAPSFIEIPRTATTTLRFGRPTSPMIVLASTGLRSPVPSSATAINNTRRPSVANSFQNTTTSNYRRPSIANSLPPRPDSVSTSTTRVYTRKASDTASFSRPYCNPTPPPQGYNNLRRPSDAPSSSTISTSGFLQLKPTRLSVIEQQQHQNAILSLQQQQIAQANYIMRSRSVTRSLQQNAVAPPVSNSVIAVDGVQSLNKRPTSIATEIAPFSPQIQEVGEIITQQPMIMHQKQGRMLYAPAAGYDVGSKHSSHYGRGQYDNKLEQADSQSVAAEDEENEENQFMRGRERHLSVYTVDSRVSTF